MTEDKLQALFDRCLDAKRLVDEDQKKVEAKKQELEVEQNRLVSAKNVLEDALADLFREFHGEGEVPYFLREMPPPPSTETE